MKPLYLLDRHGVWIRTRRLPNGFSTTEGTPAGRLRSSSGRHLGSV